MTPITATLMRLTGNALLHCGTVVSWQLDVARDYLPFGYIADQDIVAAPGQFERMDVKLKGTVTGACRFRSSN